MAAGGCGGDKETTGNPPSATATWTSAKYRMTTSYPADWKLSDTAITEDAKTGVVRIVLFHKPGPMEQGQTLEEYPPFVKVTWTPGAAPPSQAQTEAAPDEGARVMGVPTASQGVTAGWQELGGAEIRARQITFAGAPAEEGTALLNTGTALFSAYTNQLQGTPKRLRVIRITSRGGYYEVTSVVSTDPPTELAQAEQIVNALRFTQ
jgi:hypothetical protein